jgi:hypothetical protein
MEDKRIGFYEKFYILMMLLIGLAILIENLVG